LHKKPQARTPCTRNSGSTSTESGNHGNGGGGEDVLNPATQKPLAHLPHATAKDLDAALAAAEAGFKVWKAKSAYDRARIIKKAADLLRERADVIARSMTQEQGKVLAEAKGEVVTSADIVEWFAEEGRRAYGASSRAATRLCARWW
jgi:succinate-semialdehyde dehydrogenase/glutarate-semialdehyde dehydrogenase